MKKLLAVVLAAAMALSLGVVSFATAEEVKDVDVVLGPFGVEEGQLYNSDGEHIGGGVTIKPDCTIYQNLGSKYDTYLIDGDLFKVKTDKGDDNAKMIKSIGVAEKKLGNLERKGYVKIELKDDYSDSEFKLTPSVTFTAKKYFKVTVAGEKIIGIDMTSASDKAPEDGNYIAPGAKATLTYKIWLGNGSLSADQDFTAGTGGIVLKPQKNEDNEINWEDNNNTLATLTFTGDDDGKYFYPKLSTKWEDADYAEYFADQNAYIFNFTGSAAGKTAIASTSRATLELYNPYYDSEEDALSVEPENIVIYSVEEDGSLLDVTASFKAVETDDGDYVFQTKTRELGVYIIAEKAAAVAAGDVEAPAEGGKDVPNTGRF